MSLKTQISITLIFFVFVPTKMWKASIDVKTPEPMEADDWDTDPDYMNDVTEHEQRWGPGGRNVEAIE